MGNPTSGIVTLALKTLTTIQQGGEQVVYLDLAATFNPDYAVRCGLNLDILWVVRPTPYALAWEILYDLVLDGGVGGSFFTSRCQPSANPIFSARPGRPSPACKRPYAAPLACCWA